MFENKGIFFGKIKDGKIDIYNKEGLTSLLNKLEGKDVFIRIDKETNRRTIRQNNAMHLYFEMVADTCQENGIDARMFFKPEVDIPMDAAMVKRAWKITQDGMLKKQSTTELTTTEVNKVYETFDRFLSQKLKIHVEFPSIEDDPFN